MQDGTTFKWTEKRCKLAQRLNEQRLKHNSLCDTLIVSEGKEFPAHVCVLVTASGYFEGLNDQRAIAEDNAKVIKMPEKIDAPTLSKVLAYIYEGQVDITHETVIDQLYAADYLLLSDLKAICMSFLCKTLSCENCVEYMKIAYMFQLKKLYWSARRVVKCRLYDHILHTDDLYNLCDTQELQIVLCDDKVREVMQPKTLLDIISQWVNFDLGKRAPSFPILFDDSVLAVIAGASKSLQEHFMKDPLVLDNPVCAEKLKHLLKSDVKVGMKRAIQNSLCQEEESEAPETKRKKVEFEDSQLRKEKSSSNAEQEVPATCDATSDQTPSSCGLGGSMELTQIDSSLNEMMDIVIVNGLQDKRNFGYVVQEDRWVRLTDLPEKRTGHGMVQLGDKLFLIGGSQQSYVPREHCLDLRSMSWSSVPPTNHTHMKVRAIATHDGDIYIMDKSGAAERYRTELGRWIPVERYTPYLQVNSGDAEVIAQSHNGRLYVCYAYSIFGMPGTTHFQYYDLDTEMWRSLPDPSDDEGKPWILTSEHRFMSHDGRLYIVDALSGKSLEYDTDTRLWSTANKLRFPVLPSDLRPSSSFGHIAWKDTALLLDIMPSIQDATSLHICSISSAAAEQPCPWHWGSPPPFLSKIGVPPIIVKVTLPRSSVMNLSTARYTGQQDSKHCHATFFPLDLLQEKFT